MCVDNPELERPKSLEEINEQISEFANSFNRVILLIDRFIDNPLEEALDRLDPPAKIRTIKDPIFESATHRAPLLVELDYSVPSHLELSQHSLGIGMERAMGGGAPRICAWLFTHSRLNEIHDEIRQRLNVRYPNGEQLYFRYFDPRVMYQLQRILNHARDTKDTSNFFDILGSVNVWCYIGLGGRLKAHLNENACLSHFRGILRFNENVAAAIDRIGMLNRSIVEVVRNSGKYVSEGDTEIDSKIVEAGKYKITKNDDRISYAKWASINPNKFYSYPQIDILISKTLNEGMPLEAVFSLEFKLS